MLTAIFLLGSLRRKSPKVLSASEVLIFARILSPVPAFHLIALAQDLNRVQTRSMRCRWLGGRGAGDARGRWRLDSFQQRFLSGPIAGGMSFMVRHVPLWARVNLKVCVCVYLYASLCRIVCSCFMLCSAGWNGVVSDCVSMCALLVCV